MHKDRVHGTESHTAVTQIEADNCCASSTHDTPDQSSPTSSASRVPAVLGTGTVLYPHIPTLVLSERSRMVEPAPVGAIPRHILISVFLV
jgi:hypothetical protein